MPDYSLYQSETQHGGWLDKSLQPMFRRQTDTQYNAEQALAPLPVCHSIRVELLTDNTFTHWTDGRKMVVDTQGVDFEFPREVTRLITSDVESIHACLSSDLMRHATVYLIATPKQTVDLVVKFPNLDIRLLIVD